MRFHRVFWAFRSKTVRFPRKDNHQTVIITLPPPLVMSINSSFSWFSQSKRYSWAYLFIERHDIYTGRLVQSSSAKGQVNSACFIHSVLLTNVKPLIYHSFRAEEEVFGILSLCHFVQKIWQTFSRTGTSWILVHLGEYSNPNYIPYALLWIYLGTHHEDCSAKWKRQPATGRPKFAVGTVGLCCEPTFHSLRWFCCCLRMILSSQNKASPYLERADPRDIVLVGWIARKLSSWPFPQAAATMDGGSVQLWKLVPRTNVVVVVWKKTVGRSCRFQKWYTGFLLFLGLVLVAGWRTTTSCVWFTHFYMLIPGRPECLTGLACVAHKTRPNSAELLWKRKNHCSRRRRRRRWRFIHQYRKWALSPETADGSDSWLWWCCLLE